MKTLVGEMRSHLRRKLNHNPTAVTDIQANRGGQAVDWMGKGLSRSAHGIELLDADNGQLQALEADGVLSQCGTKQWRRGQLWSSAHVVDDGDGRKYTYPGSLFHV